MCGIAGWLGGQQDSEKWAARLAQALHHRGPDAEGIHFWPDATLLHTRLSIIDLSPTGQQPMSNEDGTVWTVFNGEIYNHKEIRRDLKSRGHIFRGRSDTEVIPHLYEEHGTSFVSRLRGMFALAIYDTRSQTLTLARDRFGIKPLFYAPGKTRIAFASEISALLQMPEIDLRPNRQAIYDFAALFFIPAPETFYTGIWALQPGEILEACLNSNQISWKTRTWHRWSIAPNPELTLAQATDRADELLTQAVLRQMESDVPLGALLSGGIDSSLVSVAAQAALSGGLRTFNVRFSEEEYDETWAAEAVAKHIESQHQTLNIADGQGTWDHVNALLHHAGQPFADPSLFAANAVCRLMRRHVTVALSGDGGDEGFGGYNFYWQLGAISRCRILPAPLWLGCAAILRAWVSCGIIPERLPERLQDLAGASDVDVLQNLFCWIREREHQQLCWDTDALPIRRLFEPHWEHHPPRGASRLERLSMLATEANIRLMLADDFLFKTDIASMKESLEVRVPLLDEELFEFGLSLPHRLKVSGKLCKRVFRAIAQRKLPPKVAKKPKWGFSIPVDSWVDAEFKKRLQETLLGPNSSLPDFFRPAVYQPIIKAFCDGLPHPGVSREGLYQRAIMFLSLQVALDRGRL